MNYETRSTMRQLAERRARKTRKGAESVDDMVAKISMFAKTQGNVVRSYATRLDAACAMDPKTGAAAHGTQLIMQELVLVMEKLTQETR